MPLLVGVLKDGSDAEKEHSAGALWHLAHDSTIKIALRELGEACCMLSSIAALSRLQGAAFVPAAPFSPRGSARCSSCYAGAFAPLVLLAKSGSRQQQVVAMGCMWALAHGNANNKVNPALLRNTPAPQDITPEQACLRSLGAVTAIASLLKEQVSRLQCASFRERLVCQ